MKTLIFKTVAITIFLVALIFLMVAVANMVTLALNQANHKILLILKILTSCKNHLSEQKMKKY